MVDNRDAAEFVLREGLVTWGLILHVAASYGQAEARVSTPTSGGDDPHR